eukprot:1632040-Amphidinium_carterae.1
MKAHGVEWNKLAPHKKRIFEDRAQRLRNVRSKTVGEDIDELVTTLANAEDEKCDDTGEDWMMKCCRFTPAQSASLD